MSTSTAVAPVATQLYWSGGEPEIDVDAPNPPKGHASLSQAPPIKNGWLAGQVQETKPAPEHSTNIVFVAVPVAPAAPSAPGVQGGLVDDDRC